jgi:acyl carrier protein
MERYLQDVLSKVLKLPAHRVDCDRPMGTMGLDSLMGLELVRRLSNAFEIAVPATVVFNYPTVRQLAVHLLRRLQLDAAGPLAGSKPDGEAAALPVAREITEEEALQALIAGAGERA